MLMPPVCLLKVFTPILLSFSKGKVHYSLVQCLLFISLTETIDAPEIIKTCDENDSSNMLSNTRNFIFTTLSMKGTAKYGTIKSKNLPNNK